MEAKPIKIEGYRAVYPNVFWMREEKKESIFLKLTRYTFLTQKELIARIRTEVNDYLGDMNFGHSPYDHLPQKYLEDLRKGKKSAIEHLVEHSVLGDAEGKRFLNLQRASVPKNKVPEFIKNRKAKELEYYTAFWDNNAEINWITLIGLDNRGRLPMRKEMELFLEREVSKSNIFVTNASHEEYAEVKSMVLQLYEPLADGSERILDTTEEAFEGIVISTLSQIAHCPKIIAMKGKETNEGQQILDSSDVDVRWN